MTGLLAGRRILVVEDEMLVLMNVEMMLEDLGCSAIYAAASVAQALVLVTEQNFDVAILDVNLGAEKSYPVADILKQRGVPFAFSTGYTDHGHRTDLEYWPVLRKPYLREDMVAVFRQLLDKEAA